MVAIRKGGERGGFKNESNFFSVYIIEIVGIVTPKYYCPHLVPRDCAASCKEVSLAITECYEKRRVEHAPWIKR